MKIAVFYSNTILASWTNLAIPETLRRMGHEVVAVPLPCPTSDRPIAAHQQKMTLEAMPSRDVVESCDLAIAVAFDYIHPWLTTKYPLWKVLPVKRVGLFAEQDHRDDRTMNYDHLRGLVDIAGFPYKPDAERLDGIWVKPAVDTTMFKPMPTEKKYDVAFIGTVYEKRQKFLQEMAPHLTFNMHVGEVRVYDLGGERQREWAEMYAQNLREVKVHLCLPSNNGNMMVARPLETMACGTFCVMNETPDMDELFDESMPAAGVYANPIEAVMLAGDYLRWSESREEIAKECCDYVHAHFSLEKRLQELLACVS